MKTKLFIFLFGIFLCTTVSANNDPCIDNIQNQGINDLVLPFSVYPNPLLAKKLVVNLNFQYDNNKVVFNISNVLGQSVFSYNILKEDFDNGSFTADLGDLNLDKGIYLMKMTKGDKTSVQKLVIK